MVRTKGSLTFIHRADRLDALLALLARKQIASPTRLLAGMILHEDDGAYTAAADAVLRGAAGLDM